MKAAIFFKLPEEDNEYKITMSAGKMYSALWEFSQYLRNQTKYVEVKNQDKIDKVKDEFYKILNDNDVEL